MYYALKTSRVYLIKKDKIDSKTLVKLSQTSALFLSSFFKSPILGLNDPKLISPFLLCIFRILRKIPTATLISYS